MRLKINKDKYYNKWKMKRYKKLKGWRGLKVSERFNGEEIKYAWVAYKVRDLPFIVSTVCPHGNPIINRDGWSSNKDFFRDTDISKMFPDILDIVVHLPSRLGNNYVYISDAGYSWKIISPCFS